MPDSITSPEIKRMFERVRDGQLPCFPSPEDWRDVWIYFIMVDRFNNPAAPPRFTPWDGAQNVFQGGTFNGIREQLDYIRDMGAGAIWLSPVLKNCLYDAHSYHGYGIQDFLSVDPRYASDPEAASQNPQLVEDELRALVDAAHAKGLYVIFDVVLNHTGNVFAYEGDYADLPWRDDQPYTVWWRDVDGKARPDWTELPPDPPRGAGVWPKELQHNAYFRRQGNAFSRDGNLGESGGDFYSLKELMTSFTLPSVPYGGLYPVREALIKTFQYVIARFDVDGYRIDTLKYIEPEFALWFGNAMREFALSIGKKNFYTFGEVYDDEEKIARFIGRNPLTPSDLIGVDAALDFPLFFALPDMAKGQRPPSAVVEMFERRRRIQAGNISSHGEVGKYFVTFLDNHDQAQRFYYTDPGNPHRYDDQFTLGLGCLFTLQGIACVYYGTEQGLHGSGNGPEFVREALWGKAGAASFDRNHRFYQAIQRLTDLRKKQPALRYGRQYFRPISGNGVDFGISYYPGGVLAYSRILNDQEVVIVANTNTSSGWQGEVIVDYALNLPNEVFEVIYSNQSQHMVIAPDPIFAKASSSVRVNEVDGSQTSGPSRTVRVTLQPMEIQILA
jgi:glycosidase